MSYSPKFSDSSAPNNPRIKEQTLCTKYLAFARHAARSRSCLQYGLVDTEQNAELGNRQYILLIKSQKSNKNEKGQTV